MLPDSGILTHEDYERQRDKYADLYGPDGWLLFVACDSGKELAYNVREAYYAALKKKYNGSDGIVEIPLMADITNKFEGNGHDGTCPRIPKHVGGADAYVFANVMDKRYGSDSVNENLKQLEQMSYTLKSHDAAKVTAIVPYFPYSRQDKPSFMEREAVLARAVADALVAAKVDRVVSYHPHSTGIIGSFPPDRPFRYISGLHLLEYMFSQFKDDPDATMVSTDEGGAKENKRIAKKLGIGLVIGTKDRPVKDRTDCLGFSGGEGKKRAIITDDESVTFSSCLGMIKALYEKRGIDEFYVGLSHARLDKDGMHGLEEAHEKYGLREVHTTDSVPQTEEFYKLPFVIVHKLANMWALVINHMHYNMSVSKLFSEVPLSEIF